MGPPTAGITNATAQAFQPPHSFLTTPLPHHPPPLLMQEAYTFLGKYPMQGFKTPPQTLQNPPSIQNTFSYNSTILVSFAIFIC